jgi:hypothetical protein
MKKLVVLAALVGFIGVQLCPAMPVNVARVAGYYSDGGGEFTITDPPDPVFDAIYDNYAAVATFGGGFQTFCISRTIGVKGNPLDATLDPSGVAVGTAWLYAQFARGTLDSYNYADTTDGGRALSAYQLQNAIWELQGQSFNPALAAFYVGMAVAEFETLENAMVFAPGEVDALRMTSNATASQPMLALVGFGVPDGGATLMLLGLGLSSLGAFTRRFCA